MDGHNTGAREEMALAALYSGLALANARLGAVHGFAGPLGGMQAAPHGALCARLLPAVMAGNVAALRARDPEGDALRRYAEVSRILIGDPAASVDDGIAWVESLCAALAVPALSSYGLTAAELPDLITKAAKASSMQGNPIPLTKAEMTSILRRVL
jgi:alcohol dehydrogenase class IV